MGHLHNLYVGDTDINFRRAWRVGLIVSTVFVLISVASFFTRGLNLGIEFEGGTSWEYKTSQSVTDARQVMASFGAADATIQEVGANNIRVQADTSDAKQVRKVTEALAKSAGIPTSEITVSFVGPSWGNEITDAAVRALVFFFIAIAAYITLRLEWAMAVGALVAVAHDIIITVGVYSVFQFLVTPGTVIAFLTILGYSLYDTIVVYDSARENAVRALSTGRTTYTGVMNLSMNQVLMRSVNTTLAALLPVVSMLVVGIFAVGAQPLEEFSLALFVGLLSGAYSSIFIAAPVVIWVKERDPRWRQIRARIESRGGTEAERLVPVGVAASTLSEAAGAPMPGPYTHPPRPRKGRSQARRRR